MPRVGELKKALEEGTHASMAPYHHAQYAFFIEEGDLQYLSSYLTEEEIARLQRNKAHSMPAAPGSRRPLIWYLVGGGRHRPGFAVYTNKAFSGNKNTMDGLAMRDTTEVPLPLGFFQGVTFEYKSGSTNFVVNFMGLVLVLVNTTGGKIWVPSTRRNQDT
jgi:hypothetical protein